MHKNIQWVFALSLAWFSACGQNKSTPVKAGPEIFNSKYVSLRNDTTRMMLIENVVIHYGDIYLEADSALLDKPLETITAYGIKKAVFREDTLGRDDYKTLIRYKKGEARFYTD